MYILIFGKNKQKKRDMVWGGGVFLFSDNEYKNGNNEKIKNWSRSVFVSGVHCGLLVDLSV